MKASYIVVLFKVLFSLLYLFSVSYCPRSEEFTYPFFCRWETRQMDSEHQYLCWHESVETNTKGFESKNRERKDESFYHSLAPSTQFFVLFLPPDDLTCCVSECKSVLWLVSFFFFFCPLMWMFSHQSRHRTTIPAGASILSLFCYFDVLIQEANVFILLLQDYRPNLTLASYSSREFILQTTLGKYWRCTNHDSIHGDASWNC